MSQWRHHDQKDAFLGEKESMANERQAKSTVDLTGILVCSDGIFLKGEGVPCAVEYIRTSSDAVVAFTPS